MEWISVEDRLPESRERVLIYTAQGDIMIDYTLDGFFEWQNLTHWMPLPEPPK